MNKSERRAARLAERDRAYRRVLGVPEGEDLPRQIGPAQSAGASRGGRGAAGKGRGRRK